jgi:hypothetical protein
MGVLLSERLFWVRTGLSGGPGDWPGDSYCAGAKFFPFFSPKARVLTGVVDTGGKFATGVVDTGGAP